MKNQDWQEYLSEKFSFPFQAHRVDDHDKVMWKKIEKDTLSDLDHIITVLGIESEDDLYGIIVKVSENGQKRYIPLLDLEPADKNNVNKQYIDEYSEFFRME